MSNVTITLNGNDLEVPAGARLIDVIKAHGEEEVPHYCYHPGLSIAGSCRLCAVEVGNKDAEGNVKMMPKVMMSCQMNVSDGMIVNTHDDRSKQHRKEIMEFLLINHPLDCPVCDQAGECYLQDYSYDHGQAESRFIEDKIKQSKKQVGERILLYGDRCIMCSRCVRFTREISGGAELMVNERGNASEIDVFPGYGVNDNLAGNVVDLCPVGALLDTDFLFKQRVWELQGTDSVCTGCSRGCNIHIDQNMGVIYRLKPRYNPDVNEWWMCDEGRFGFKFVHADTRLKKSRLPQIEVTAAEALQRIKTLWRGQLDVNADARLAVVISPQASCEEQWLLAQWARGESDAAILVRGPVFSKGQEQKFKAGFTVSPEKAPNRRGMEKVLAEMGGHQMNFGELAEAAASEQVHTILVQGGYPWQDWCPPDITGKLRQADNLFVLDIFESELTRKADVTLAGVSWAEKHGSFINDQDLQQKFNRALVPYTDDLDDLNMLWKLTGRDGEASLIAVRKELSDPQAIANHSETDAVGAGS